MISKIRNQKLSYSVGISFYEGGIDYGAQIYCCGQVNKVERTKIQKDSSLVRYLETQYLCPICKKNVLIVEYQVHDEPQPSIVHFMKDIHIEYLKTKITINIPYD